MRRNDLYNFVRGSCGIVLLAGCNMSGAFVNTSTGGAAGGTTTVPPALPSATQKNIYVVQSGRQPISTLVLPLSTQGAGTPTLEIPGSGVAVDGAGYVYVLDQKGYPSFEVTSINVYSPDTSTGPVHSLPVGPGTKIASLYSITVSQAGEIFVNDGTGVAVFAAGASGNDDPVRYIVAKDSAGSPMKIWSRYMAVDNAGDLYVAGNGVLVFGPKDTGLVAPLRMIAGSLTHVGAAGCPYGGYIAGIAVDEFRDLFVLSTCQTELHSDSPPAIYEFGPGANGNVSPIRSLISRALVGSTEAGLAVDSAGTIYVTNRASTVLEYAPNASGDVSPANTVTSLAWQLMAPPPGEDEWYDPSGPIALH